MQGKRFEICVDCHDTCGVDIVLVLIRELESMVYAYVRDTDA